MTNTKRFGKESDNPEVRAYANAAELDDFTMRRVLVERGNVGAGVHEMQRPQLVSLYVGMYLEATR